jgi:hypothetical protein
VTVKLKISWINDCEYELKQVWSDSKSLRKYNGAITRVMITKITGDKEGYEYSCACKEETDRVRSKGIMRREF